MKMKKIGLAGLGIAAVAYAPPAAADVPGLAPFVGSWHAHEEGLDVQPNGNGRETYPDKSTPSCDWWRLGSGVGEKADLQHSSSTIPGLARCGNQTRPAACTEPTPR
jgi:hypothetical protein